jgi:hypothetical protein
LEEKNMGSILANAGDLARWADSLYAQGLLPKLVRQLILATTESITRIGIRSEEGIRYAGFDGIVEAGEGNLFVPAGVSVWEMGVNQDPKGKAESDYTKRTEDPLGVDPSQTAFVFVTPRRWAGKEDWAEEKRASGQWRDIRVIDADDLETWLERAPAVHVWISRQIGKDPGDVRPLDLFWIDWSEATSPPISSELVTAGRKKEMTRIVDHLQGPPAIVTVRADAQNEALAFIAATLEQLPERERDAKYARTVIVDSVQAWRHIILTEQPLVLLPTFRSDEIIQAVRRGHYVLIPVGREIAEAKDTVTLPRLPRRAVEEALQAIGLNQSRSTLLAALAHRSLYSLRRILSPYPEIYQPTWASPDKARGVLPALLAGSWDEAVPGDQDALAALAGCSYEEFSGQLARYASESDPPVRQAESVWTIVSKEDAWRLLPQVLTRHDMEQLRHIVLEILGTLNPALELSVEERWMANALKKSRPHSTYLREGLADTVALMAVRASDVILGGTYSGEDHATGIVIHLLQQANEDSTGRLWTSLSDVLPLLAEAAPDIFLNAVDTASTGDDPLIRKLFTDTAGSIFEVHSAHTELLWALERLAWSPDYLSNAALALARLTRLDPGGRLANRPGSSLRSIFVSWYPQTSATFEERLQVLDMLREQEPAVSWKLMLSLLPRPYETVDPAHAPQWREWKPEEQNFSYTPAELWKAAEELITRLLADVGSDSTRLGDIIERIGHLPPPLRARVCDYLEALDLSTFDIDSREAIGAQLLKLISEHRRFSKARWAMPIADVERLTVIYEQFTQGNSTRYILSLFTASPKLLDEPEGIDIQRHEEAIYQARVAAVQQIYQDEGLTGLVRLIESVEGPGILGWVLGRIGIVQTEEELLLSKLGSPDTRFRQAAMEYVAGRFLTQGWQWVDEKLHGNALHWSPQQQADFFLRLPANSETWDRLGGFGEETMKYYWTQTFPYVEKPAECLRAVKHLLDHGRAWQAVDLLASYLDTVKPEAEIAMGVLEAALATPVDHLIGQSLLLGISQMFTYLEHTEDVDERRLGQMEWLLLPLFRYEKHPMKILHGLIATDPEFFVDVVSTAYRAAGEEPRALNEQEQVLAQKAYDLLHSASRVPGSQEDGSIDATALAEWVGETRRQLQECKRLEIGDQCIGHILHHTKHDEDELWPPLVIRNLLEKVRSDDIELGLELAEHNGRGVIWRNPLAGGEQERVLVARYLAQAQKLRMKWPRTAAMLRRIAKGYTSEAQMWDTDAKRREDS